jgi:uncharacterized protein YcfL
MKKIVLFISAAAIIAGCSTNAVTGRKQLSLIPESELQAQAITQYKSFLSTSKVVNPSASRDAEMVNRVGNIILHRAKRIYLMVTNGSLIL